MKSCIPIQENIGNLEDFSGLDDTLTDIRPLAVRPLNHSERVPNPWGFLFSSPPVPGALPAPAGGEWS